MAENNKPIIQKCCKFNRWNDIIEFMEIMVDKERYEKYYETLIRKRTTDNKNYCFKMSYVLICIFSLHNEIINDDGIKFKSGKTTI